MDLRTIAILGGSSVVLLCGLAYSLLCVFAPRKAILMQAQFSTLVTEESASDRTVRLKYRITGVILTLFIAFFELILVGKVLGF
jgi:hypothetical protein